MAAHKSEQHSDWECPQCQARVPVRSAEAHTGACPNRPTYCEYCELDIPLAQHASHQDACSARTKQCFSCQGIFTLRNYPAHDCRPRASSQAEPPAPARAEPPALALRHQISEPVDQQPR